MQTNFNFNINKATPSSTGTLLVLALVVIELYVHVACAINARPVTDHRRGQSVAGHTQLTVRDVPPGLPDGLGEQLAIASAIAGLEIAA